MKLDSIGYQMSKSTKQIMIEAISALERDGRKVHKVVMEGRRIELVLTSPDDEGLGNITWR